jgi:hypothetical protein
LPAHPEYYARYLVSKVIHSVSASPRNDVYEVSEVVSKALNSYPGPVQLANHFLLSLKETLEGYKANPSQDQNPEQHTQINEALKKIDELSDKIGNLMNAHRHKS